MRGSKRGSCVCTFFLFLVLVRGFSFSLAAQTIESKRCQLPCRLRLHPLSTYVFASSSLCGCVQTRFVLCVCACNHVWTAYMPAGGNTPSSFSVTAKSLICFAHMRWQQWASCLSLLTVFTPNSDRFSRATDSTAAQHTQGIQRKRDTARKRQQMGGWSSGFVRNIFKRKKDVAEWPRIGVVGRDGRKNSHCNICSGWDRDRWGRLWTQNNQGPTTRAGLSGSWLIQDTQGGDILGMGAEAKSWQAL